jgi:succinate dehydrogenase/fumarate reductase-like Fe-S protein
MAEATFEIFRGNSDGGQSVTYRVPIAPGMVVLDALHHIQAHKAHDLAVRWNCKAGKCGSCSAEVNGRPRLTCKTRMDALPLDKPIAPVLSGRCIRRMWIVCRNFVSASSASCARMCATFSASTSKWSSSEDRDFSSELRASKCIPSIPSHAPRCSRRNSALASATSPSAVPRYVLRRFISPTTQSFL